ncbi:hypothetical protein [Aquimarina litoralis]|uniref:hypothetical protein n=1 Tax=Aquimarina litoralis TaxID=584605 RepID=UPI0031D347CF
MKRKEIFWLIGTAIFALILNFCLFGVDGFKSESVTDINVHDTYFVIADFHFIILISVLIFFGIYLIRVLKRNFKNLSANLILIIATILFSIVMDGVSTIVDTFAQLTNGWTIYPTLAGEVEPKPKNSENNFGIIFSIIFVFQILLLILLAYCGFKTGLNYKRIE